MLGAGSWGTVLAIHLARGGHNVALWTRDPAQHRDMAARGRNDRYAPGAAFPPTLTPTADLATALGGADEVLIVVPSHAFRGTVQRMRPHLGSRHRIAWGTKGFERGTRHLLHRVVVEELGDVPAAVVSGPTFASEVVRGLPCALTVASADAAFAHDVARALSTAQMLCFTSDDVVGVEVGGATKNVIAVATGACDGLGFGANARAALITRGLAEIMRLGEALGGRRETLMGLAGLGDLVLTCSDDQSRNRRFGLALGRGLDVATARASIGQVVEGMVAADAVHRLARDHDVAMPICEQVHAVVNAGRATRDAVTALTRWVPQPEV